MAKKFNDIKFKQHKVVNDAKHGEIKFKNGYSLSLIYGGVFTNDPKYSYEIGIKYRGKLTVLTALGDSIVSGLDKEGVEYYLDVVEKLPDPRVVDKDVPF